MLSNNNGMSGVVADAIQPKPYVPVGSSDYSATSLIKSPRQLQLEKRHKSEVSEDVTDHWAFWIGNCIHEKLERDLERWFPTRYVVERKVTRFDEGRRVVAKTDLYDTELQRVCDHKTTRIGMRADPALWTEFKQDWKEQLMINAFMLMGEGLPVKELSINLVFLDWKPFTAKMKKATEYPQAPAIELVIPCPSYEECEEFYYSKLNEHIAHEDTPDDELPPCSQDYIWAKPTKWAVQNKNTGRAKKLCDSKAEADQYLLNEIKTSRHLYEVAERKGGRFRCENFCSVCEFCNAHKESK